jgi:SAM-dependent methyltransferase
VGANTLARFATLTPAPVRSALEGPYQRVARELAARPYRRRYDGPFLAEVHPEDDLMHHSLMVARGEAPAVGLIPGEQPFPYYRALRMYYDGGDFQVAEVEALLRRAGAPLEQTGSLLEFAGGFGRMTRHLVHRLDASRITVSDIDHRGVAFARERLGVAGFGSTATPDELAHDGRYEVITAVSLFSHLSLADWEPWLKRLYGMLEPGGVLLFTVHGSHAYETSQAQFGSEAFEQQAEGFHYTGANETRGRLAGAHYGVSFVTEAYVRRAATATDTGAELEFFALGLTGYQDVYVMRRAAP